MSKAGRWGPTKAHVRRMAKMMAAGACIFMAFLASVHIALSLAGKTPDPTFYYFYPITAVLGALFGFERWWGLEQGEYNPFHDR